MYCNAILILMAWALTVFRECFQRLVDQSNIILINIQAQETETTYKWDIFYSLSIFGVIVYLPVVEPHMQSKNLKKAH